MNRFSLVEEAHRQIRKYLKPGDTAVDATAGNGHDTLFLANLVGNSGRVFAFDIQQQALQTTFNRLQTHAMLEQCILFHASHAGMSDKIPVQCRGNINAIMFNLGYLPRGDKSIITSANSTIIGLQSAIDLLAANGILTVIAYPGHPGGKIETEQVTEWCEPLDNGKFSKQIISNQTLSSPVLFSLIKKN